MYVDARLSLEIRDRGQHGNTANVGSYCLSGSLPTCLPPAPEAFITSWTQEDACLPVVSQRKEERWLPWRYRSLSAFTVTMGNRVAVSSYKGILVGRFTRDVFIPLELLLPSASLSPAPHWSLRHFILRGCRHAPSGTELEQCFVDGTVGNLVSCPLHSYFALSWPWK